MKMGNADAGDVDARLQQRLQDVNQREQTARQAHTQKRAEVSAKLQRLMIVVTTTFHPVILEVTVESGHIRVKVVRAY